MRRIITSLGALLLTATLILAGDNSIFVVRPFDSTACLVNTTNYSVSYDLNTYKPASFTYALQLLVTNLYTTNGIGVAEISYELSNNNETYLTNVVIATGLSYTNSPTSGGNGFYEFDAEKSRYIRFKAIVTTTNCFITGWLAIQ